MVTATESNAPHRALSPKLSIVIPIYNEATNLFRLFADITPHAAKLEAEIIAVDDGSNDGGEKILRAFPGVIHVSLPHGGKTAALFEGVRRAGGSIIAFLDADLQDDPAFLEAMIEKIGRGCGCVTARRVRRTDGLWKKRVPSWLFNRLVKLLFRLPTRELGGGFRVCRAEALRRIPWFPGSHRFIPLLVSLAGFPIAEIPVPHRPRLSGKAKFDSPVRFIETLRGLLAILRGLRYTG